MKYLIAILLSTLTIISCSTFELSQNCRHKAILQKSLINEYTSLPTRAAFGIVRGTKLHVQLQVFIDGEWRYVVQYPEKVFISTGAQDKNFRVIEYTTIEELRKRGWM